MSHYKFYLETNSVYSIGKIKQEIIDYSFTSAFALFELISNITADNYSKRKSILKKIDDSKITIDWQFPQEIIFNSFDYFEEFKFVDKRIEHLKNLIALILKSKSFVDLKKLNDKIEFGLGYFEKMDRNLGINFINASSFSNRELKSIMEKSSEPTQVSISGITYEISDYSSLRNFFKKEHSFNRSVTILALAKMMQTSFPEFVEDDDDLELLYASYNGGVDVWVEYFSEYCSHKYVERELPAMNDFMDFAHLIYLKKNQNLTIVSDDKIFKKMKIKNLETKTLSGQSEGN